MATPQLKEPVSGSFSALVEDARLLQQALEIAREDPEAFERTTGLDVPYDVAVRQMERALEGILTRLAGLGITSRLVPAPDDATLNHNR